MKWVPKHLYTILLSLPLSYRKRFPMPNGEDYNTYSSHFILRISMVILRNRRTIITIIRKVKNVHAFRRRWERYTRSKLHHNSNKLWNQGQSKNIFEFKCFEYYVSTWYLARWSLATEIHSSFKTYYKTMHI